MADEIPPDQDVLPPLPAPPIPGDIVQVTLKEHRFFRVIGLVREAHRWGVAVDFLAVTETTGRVGVAQDRFRLGEFVTVGAAVFMPADVQRAREEALETARLVAEDANRG